MNTKSSLSDINRCLESEINQQEWILVHLVKVNAKKESRFIGPEKEGDLGDFLKEGRPGLSSFTFRELFLYII